MKLMRSRIFKQALCTTVVLLAACTNWESVAPRVDSRKVSLDIPGSTSASRAAYLDNGRHLYLAYCARCHSPEPILDYDSTEWAEILPRMFEETPLDPEEAVAVRRYIEAVLEQSTSPRPQ